MKVVHLASGCVSGSPLRMVNALNKYTAFNAILVTNSDQIARNRLFETGLDWRCNKEEVVGVIEDTDILHVHDRDALKLLNDCDFIKRHTRIVFHHHGPGYIALKSPKAGHSIASMSIAQYPERYAPRARIVPNPVVDEGKTSFSDEPNEPIRIFFSPTFCHSSWDVPQNLERWVTKGRGEVLALLNRVQARNGMGWSTRPVDIQFLKNRPFDECMQVKRNADLVIDDVVTGSYHLVGLEALAMGIPTLGYVDRRMERLLKEITGAVSIPWINVRLEDLEETLRVLLNDFDLRRAVGEASYEWMQKYYNEDTIIQHLVDAYKDLIENPERFNPKRFDSASRIANWFVSDSYDLVYQSRKIAKQRGAEALGSAAYMDHEDVEFQSSSLKTMAWISQERYPFGTWLYQNRYKRIDAQSELFHAKKRSAMLEKYKFAFSYSKDRRVVDFGSGTGYGSQLLKLEGRATAVIGVEKDPLAVAYAEEIHACDGVHYVEKDVLQSGLPDASFGLVVAIDIIEWVDCDHSFIDACRRLLSPRGVCVISAGDFWRNDSERFYKRKYSPITFKNILESSFRSVCIYRQLFLSGEAVCSFVPEVTFSPLKEGESLIAISRL